jgi:hypothetical protein
MADTSIVLVMPALDASAVARLLRAFGAVANPYTTILGHMTGRQLLRRPGYDIDIEKVRRLASSLPPPRPALRRTQTRRSSPTARRRVRSSQ